MAIEVQEYEPRADNAPINAANPGRSSGGRRPHPSWMYVTGAAFVAGLCATAFVMRAPRTAQDVVVSRPRPASAESAEAPSLPHSRSDAKVQSAPASAQQTDSTGAAGGDAPTDMLPVSFNLWNRPKQHRILGSVQNLTAEAMLLTIRASNEGTQNKSAEIQIDLAPGEQKSFSSDELDMSTQDRLIFHSPPYQDLQTTVP
jgi:hypothetical protein